MRACRISHYGIVLALVFALLTVGCGGSKSLSRMTAGELFEKGRKAYEKEKYLKAIEILESCVYNYPGETIVDTAQYYLALAYFGNGEYEVAQVEFNRLALNYPASVYFENAIFMRAVCHFEATPSHYGLDQDQLQTAIKEFEDFTIDFPESDIAEDARKYLLVARTRLARKCYESGVVYDRIGAYEAARIYFQRVIDDYTDTEFAPLATYEYACMDFKLNEFDAARGKFEDFFAVFPDHELAPRAAEKAVVAAFKSGEAAFKRGDYTLAQQKLELFKRDFPDNELTEKADDYLNRITSAAPDSVQVENADS